MLAGRDPRELLDDVLALFIGLIATVDAPRLRIGLGIGNPHPFTELQARLTYIVRFVEERESGSPPSTTQAVKSLREARSMAFLVLRGESHALKRMIAALTRAATWADKRGFRWPLI